MRTDIINSENFEVIKWDALRLIGMAGDFIADIYQEIETAMSGFTYENELIETMVFSFLKAKIERWNSSFIN